MKKAFDQTVRDIKREVNKKVLKVPSIEQKVLDSTSNEPWGPHGSLLADIAQATRNYHEYQMIMTVIWKRINDTGKNWRHVYKALIVLEYLVASGSERVIDEIKEHAYQISTLSNFQYIDSSGRDQGSNIRRKSASLVDLVNDRERIIEVRQKAVANRDKFRGPSTGGTYRLSSYASTGSYGDRYDDDRNESRYGSRDDGWGYRDTDRYSRSSDAYGQEIERHSRDSDERDGRDDELRGRRHSISDYHSGSRSRSSDRERQYDDDSQDGKRLGRKFSEQNLGAPPSYEEAVAGVRSPGSNSRHNDEYAEATNAHISPPRSANPVQVTSTSTANQGNDAFDEFDPRNSVTTTSAATNNTDFDLLGTLSEPVPSNALTIMPSMTPENSAPVPSFEAATSSGAFEVNKGFDDPFGDSPFKAVSTDSAETHPLAMQNPNPTLSGTHQPPTQNPYLALPETQQPVAQNPYLALPETQQPVAQNPYLTLPEAQQPVMQNPYVTLPETQQPAVQNPNVAFPEAQQSRVASMQNPDIAPTETTAPSTVANFDFGDTLGGLTYTTPGPTVPFSPTNTQYLSQEPSNSNPYTDVLAGILPPPDSIQQPAPQSIFPGAGGNFQQPNEGVFVHDGNFLPPAYQPQQTQTPSTMMMSAPSPIATVQPKFEPKSAVWADTLSRGLVNLNISGPKINPLADIGVDFDAINRKEKRMEKPAAANPVTMGKAMGSGSGIGRAGASALRAPPGQMMGVNPPGMGMNMGYGMGMNMGQMPAQMPPGSVMPGGYNPNLGSGYMPPHQQQYPYGGGYR